MNDISLVSEKWSLNYEAKYGYVQNIMVLAIYIKEIWHKG